MLRRRIERAASTGRTDGKVSLFVAMTAAAGLGASNARPDGLKEATG